MSPLLNKKSRGKGCVGVRGEERRSGEKGWGWGAVRDPVLYSAVLSLADLHQIVFFFSSFSFLFARGAHRWRYYSCFISQVPTRADTN